MNGIYSGVPLQDFLFYFRRVNNNLHFVLRNVNFFVLVQAIRKREHSTFLVTQFSTHPPKALIKAPNNLIDLGNLLLTVSFRIIVAVVIAVSPSNWTKPNLISALPAFP